MASFLRVIVALVLLSLSAAASAQSYPYLRIEYRHELGTTWHVDPTAACRSAAPTATSGSYVFEELGNLTSDPPFCWYKWVGSGVPDSSHAAYSSLSTKRICPWGSISQGGKCVVNQACPSGLPRDSVGQCTCPAGAELDNSTGQCLSSDKANCWNFSQTATLPGGDLTVDYRYSGNVPNGKKFCVPVDGMSSPSKGCTVTFNRESFYDYGGGNAVTEGTLSMASDSNTVDQSCSLGPGKEPGQEPPDEKCPSGFTGTVNGVEVCVDKVPDSGFEPGRDETTVDDGENTTTNRTNSETKCENGRCTTTTTVTTTVTNNATGATTTTSTNTTTTQSQESFCKANPKAKLCGGSGLPNIDGGGTGGGGNGEEDPSSFTGACSGGFQCKGDAIQCAIAREQHIRACRLFDKESPESKLYEEFKGKEGDQTKELPGNETVAIGDRINSSDALGAGGAGLSDLNLTVWNQQVSLPLSMLNQYLAAMGNVLLAVSFLLAFRIVARG